MASGRLRPVGTIRSMHMRMAAGSPALARSITLATISSACSAKASSSARVFLLSEPGGRPAGLPL
jgi:hypothetical protein